MHTGGRARRLWNTTPRLLRGSVYKKKNNEIAKRRDKIHSGYVQSTMTEKEVKIISDVITRLLVTREHSRHELLNKLLSRGLDANTCLEQIEHFNSQGLQSDLRFTQALVRSRVRKGQGEQRIRAELNEHRITNELIESALQEADIDWFELARRTMEKKFGDEAAESWQEIQKRSRFLQYRGFNLDQIKYANESLKNSQVSP